MLNVLDGSYVPTNVLFMMTTNRIEIWMKPCFGRDALTTSYILGKASDRQKAELYRRFFPEASEFEGEAFVESHVSAEMMAEFQGLLLGLEQDQGERELVGLRETRS